MRKILPAFLLLMAVLYFPVRAYAQIDVPKWMDDIGGPNSSCISSGVQVDKQNNVYITGLFSNVVDFDPSSGVYNLTAAGVYDTFIAKYTTDGKFIWAIRIGGTNVTTQVNSLAVDASGNPIISGQFDGNINVDPSGNTTLNNNGGNDAFVVKFSSSGALLWAKDIGGPETDFGGHVSVDSQSNVIECVRYENSVTVGSTTYTSQSGSNNFNGLTIKYDPNGNVLWAVNLGDVSHSESDYSGIDSQDNIVATGHFEGNDNFNPLGTAVMLNGNGNSIFIAKYTSAGILTWVKSFNGSAGLVGATAIVSVNSKNEIYVDGPFTGTTNFGGTTLNPTGSQDLYLAKYAANGSFVAAKDIGGTSGNSVTNYGILSSQDDNVYISGYFKGTIDFDPSPATQANLTYHGQQDFFLAKYDENLNYKYAFNGGNDVCTNNLGRALGIDYNNAVLFTGSFCSTVNFSASSCSPDPLTAQSSVRDCFLGKYIQNTATSAAQISAFSIPQQSSPAVIDQTNLIITVTVPQGTNITALVPTITYTSGVSISPASGQAENFTGGVTYTLTGSCNTLNYTVNVIYAAVATQLTTCSGNTSTLNGTTATPVPDSYLWQTLQGSTWVNAAGTNNTANYQTAVLTYNSNANVVVDFRRQIITGGTVTFDSYYDITVQPALANNILTDPADSVFCTSGDPSVITGTTPTGGAGTYTYQWQSSTDGSTYTNINGATAINYDPPALTVTTYYKRVVTSGTCATSGSNVIKILITAPPSPPANAVTSTCQGSTATITIPAQTGITYNWYDTPAKTTLLYTGLSYTTPPVAQNITYYIEANNGSCSSTSLATAQVNIIPPPSAPQVNNSNVTTCSGTQVTLNIVNPQTGYTYNWYTTATGGTESGTGIDFTTPALTANTVYYAEGVNSNGCVSATRTPVNITAAPLPDITAQSASACPNTSAVLSAQSSDANATINWYASASGGDILYTGPTFTTPDLIASTSYYAEAVDKTTQCVSAQRAVATASVLTQLATPVVTVQSTSPTEITFQWGAVPGASAYKVSTDDGETFVDPSSGTDGLYNTISNLSLGQTVTIIVEALGTSSCQTSEKSAAVTAIAQYPQNDIIYVANAFTPNGDGRNDVVYVHGNGIQSMNFHIYDQFGELIFSSSSLTVGWNGTYKGTMQPVGVYVYYVVAQMYNGQKISKKGTITLLK